MAKIWRPTDPTCDGEMVLPNTLVAGEGWTACGATDRDPDLAAITIWAHRDSDRHMLLPGGWAAPNDAWEHVGSLAEKPPAAWPTPEQLTPLEDGIHPVAAEAACAGPGLENDDQLITPATPTPTTAFNDSRTRFGARPLAAALVGVAALVAGASWLLLRDTEPEPERLINMWAVIVGDDHIIGDRWNSCGGAGALSAFRPGGQGEVLDRDGDLVGVVSIGDIENLIPAMSLFDSVSFGVAEEPDVEIAMRLRIINAFPRACFLHIRAEGLPPRDLYKIMIGGESFIVEGELGNGFSTDGVAYRGDWRLGF